MDVHHEHPGAPPAEGAAPDSPDGIWLAATWPFIRGQLPSPPARVIEVGCGPFGGHVPALIRAGYDATGIDPEAPEGAAYRRVAFEGYRPEGSGVPADAVIASVSLHHVADPGAALDHVAEVLRPDGAVIVIEWFSEDFDEATAQWCFRHHPREPDGPGGWLARLRADWAESGLSWDEFFGGWLGEHGLHPARVIRRELDARFTATHLSSAPYYFPELLDADAAAEQAAIEAGQLRAGCLRYAGRASRPRRGYEVSPIGRVESPLTDLTQAPMQGDEGAPPAWLVIEPHVAEGIRGLRAGDHVIVLSWLDRADRGVLITRPRNDPGRAPAGVFGTRSPDRPNPIGLHPVEILAVDGLRIMVSNLELIDGTPILDIKSVLRPVGER